MNKTTYRKKPVEVQAFQLPGLSEDVGEFMAWAYTVGFDNFMWKGKGSIAIDTLEGEMIGSPGDYIIQGVQHEFYPCKPDIFHATYELVQKDNSNDEST